MCGRLLMLFDILFFIACITHKNVPTNQMAQLHNVVWIMQYNVLCICFHIHNIMLCEQERVVVTIDHSHTYREMR